MSRRVAAGRAAIGWAALAGVLPFVAAFGYTGRPWLAAVPVSVAGLRLATLPAVAAFRGLGLFLGLLGLLLGSAFVSALVHPSREAAVLLESLGACCALAVLVALGPAAVVVRLWLAVATAVVLVLVVLTALSDPAQFAAKMPVGSAWLVDHLGSGIALGRGALHANGVAALAAVAASGWVAAAVVAGSWRRRLVALVTAAVLAGVLAASGSRGGLVALGGGALAGVAGRWHPLLIGAAGAATLAALAGLVAIGLLTASPADLREPSRASAPGAGGGLTDLAWRAIVWRGTLAGIAESPVLGRGIGSFPLAYAPDRIAEAPVNSHSGLLQVWLDLGLPGLLAVVGLTVQALVTAARRAPACPLALVVAAAGVAWVAGSMVESTVLVSVSAEEPWRGTAEVAVPLVFGLWGLAAAVGRREASA